MAEYTREVTEAQWAKTEPLLPKPPRSPKEAVAASNQPIQVRPTTRASRLDPL